MRRFHLLAVLACFVIIPKIGNSQNYTLAKAPLRQNPYIQLPLGAITPQGWLRQMLIKQKEGATGNLDKLYPLVMGNRNGWLGGDGDQWERGPYWIDGLLPLAYILKDKELIAKVKPWIEWTIKSQQPDGYFGPSKDYGYEPGIQRDNSRDWWPKMVMLKVLQQYYTATGDKRVINLLTNYFHYQLKELPKEPLNHWTFWAEWRGGDNLMVVYWLYNITGDKSLLDLGDLIHKQTFDFTGAFLKGKMLTDLGSAHGVNLAEGMKEPLIYYQQHPEQQYIDAMEKGLYDLTKYNGMAHGLFGADESLHGNNPTQGSELCTAVEMMFTLENSLTITGGVDYADRLEKIAFNALPAQTSEDYLSRQYFQQANQVMLTRDARNFNVNHAGTDVCYGLLTGYPCCTSNMHQGWPKFTQNLWYATPDNGLAALVYSASDVSANVANGVPVTFKEETNYPFDENIRFTLSLNKKTKSVTFPLDLRIPAWCKNATIKVNGAELQQSAGNQVVKINREWKNGDVVELQLPMHIFKNTWYENSVSVERGPLVYALKIGEAVTTVKNDRDPVAYGIEYTEVRPTTPWNYGLIDVRANQLEKAFTLQKKDQVATYPWNLTNAPLQLTVKARRIPNWTLYNDMTGPMPYSVIYNEGTPKEKDEEVTLVPYGCTKLRISQFPVVGR
ncbi:beta-L-arabinofuranosidase domain-containing protein [Mucilaginibacter sp. dw_454]|uniref:beta-L-arabinofuranosidase domain-containing protein n=1 Tax=Mucilaginibacter sp. dw_454 TaxID=2720079 RepID=UPI001BD2316C|nr:beta-L-arabinofuranosidase domain-containing protein [Mucilaginibacter sp. dw_454]